MQKRGNFLPSIKLTSARRPPKGDAHPGHHHAATDSAQFVWGHFPWVKRRYPRERAVSDSYRYFKQLGRCVPTENYSVDISKLSFVSILEGCQRKRHLDEELLDWPRQHWTAKIEFNRQDHETPRQRSICSKLLQIVEAIGKQRLQRLPADLAGNLLQPFPAKPFVKQKVNP